MKITLIEFSSGQEFVIRTIEPLGSELSAHIRKENTWPDVLIVPEPNPDQSKPQVGFFTVQDYDSTSAVYARTSGWRVENL